jgi:hypothetical protein
MVDWIKQQGGDPNDTVWQGRFMANESMSMRGGKPAFPKTRGAIMSGSQDDISRAGTVEYEAPATRHSPATQAERIRNARGVAARTAPGASGAQRTDATGTSVSDQTSGGDRVTEQQSKVAAVRRRPIDPRLKDALEYAASASGTRVGVTSGGQHRHGHGPRTGSLRHDEGLAADFDLRDENGKIIPRGDPRRLKFLEEAARAGAGGTGTGYMRDPRKIHAGITGAGGKIGEGLGAYSGSPAERDAVARGLANRLTPEQLAAARAARGAGATARIDGAINTSAQGATKAEGSVNVNITSNGTAARAKTNVRGALWQQSTVRNQRQMAQTAAPDTAPVDSGTE